ncbi:MAG: ferrochelatase [Hyphomonadaceae bacterium]|nr:MAG: ferrochelatase [Hyphomonadaceae bacterium]KAF0187163.1 MAG: ferrochelatase [Hyphomonadaceae bacterium]
MPKEMAQKKIAVVLFNLGGPDCQDDVRPFLRNLFSDKAIIGLPAIFRFPLAWLISTLRAPKSRPLYALMGGGSPLLANTKSQAMALQNELAARHKGSEIKVFIAMRYWHPFCKQAAKEVEKFEPDEVVLLPLYPQYSLTTTGSSLVEWNKRYKAPCKIINEYPITAGFVSSVAAEILLEYEKLGSPNEVRVLFSAHGLPKKNIDNGDPYEAQIRLSANGVAKLLPENFQFVTCYQSKVGPLEWLGPATTGEIAKAANDKIGIIICPISFVSEHIETLVELDLEYKKLALDMGVPFFGRSRTVGTNKVFIGSLADLVDEKLLEI